MNKTIIYICFFFLAIATHGKTYYFDATNGNDTNSGLAPNKAFKSLFKIKTLNLKPGDVILLNAGGIFHKPLHLENIHGTINAPIRISTFQNIVMLMRLCSYRNFWAVKCPFNKRL